MELHQPSLRIFRLLESQFMRLPRGTSHVLMPLQINLEFPIAMKVTIHSLMIHKSMSSMYLQRRIFTTEMLYQRLKQENISFLRSPSPSPPKRQLKSQKRLDAGKYSLWKRCGRAFCRRWLNYSNFLMKELSGNQELSMPITANIYCRNVPRDCGILN